MIAPVATHGEVVPASKPPLMISVADAGAAAAAAAAANRVAQSSGNCLNYFMNRSLL